MQDDDEKELDLETKNLEDERVVKERDNEDERQNVDADEEGENVFSIQYDAKR